MTETIPAMLSTAEFARAIEEIVVGTGADYIDAVVDYCHKHNIEVETAAAIIKSSPIMKGKLQVEAENLNILPKTSRLPV